MAWQQRGAVSILERLRAQQQPPPQEPAAETDGENVQHWQAPVGSTRSTQALIDRLADQFTDSPAALDQLRASRSFWNARQERARIFPLVRCNLACTVILQTILAPEQLNGEGDSTDLVLARISLGPLDA